MVKNAAISYDEAMGFKCLAPGFCVLAALVACGSDTTVLFVDLRTDMVPGAEFGGVRVVVGDVRDDVVATLDQDFLSGQRVARFEGLERGTIEGVLQLVSATGVVLEREFRVELRTEVQTATIVLSRDCRGVECAGAATACLGGRCIDPRCTVEASDFCAIDDCRLASDCAGLDPCSEPSCQLRTCLHGDGHRCLEGMYCSPEFGCLSAPDSSDAGVADAGDASLDAGDASLDASLDACMGLVCGAECVDSQTNPAHCGRCGMSCGADVCFDGACTTRDACTDTLGVPCDQVIGSYLKASNAGLGDLFNVVSVDGDTLAVGARSEDSAARGVDGDQADDSLSSAGAVYVFRRVAGVWAQEAYLKASNTDGGDSFGTTLSLSGDTLAVGAPSEASSASGVDGAQDNNDRSRSGAAYVFTRSGGTWTQQAYLKASNPGDVDSFGWSISLEGDTLAVGAIKESSGAPGVDGDQTDDSMNWAGAVYVFRRTGAAWAQQAYLKASNPGRDDFFGASVSLSGDTLAVGASVESSAATGIDGDQLDDSAFSAGAVYVFRRTGSAWAQEAYIKASNAEFNDHFGEAVSLSGDTLAVGANDESSSATGVDGDQEDNSAGSSGAVYVFHRVGTTWTQQAYLKALNTGANDQFGEALALSGDTLAVGAQDDSGATDLNGDESDVSESGSGAIHIFRRVGNRWSQVGFLKASNTNSGDGFGSSVSLRSGQLAVGAPLEASAATGVDGDQLDNTLGFCGAAYTYRIAP